MRIGIDVGGTKIEGVALDRDGRELFRIRVDTPAGNYRATVDAIDSLVGGLEQKTGATGSVGIGIPGTVSRASGLVKNANSTCLIGQPFDRDISERLNRPVRIANDADCFTISEATDGAAADYPSVFGVILGTGVGGGIAVGGSLLSGPNGIAGEWGHNPLPLEEAGTAPECYCGRLGCIETYLSGPGLSADHFRRTGKALTADRIAAAAAAGEPDASASLGRYEKRLARALSGVINIVDPAAIVLGGGLSNIAGLYEKIPPLLAGHVFSDTMETVLLRAAHGDSSGVRGAAFLWPEDS